MNERMGRWVGGWVGGRGLTRRDEVAGAPIAELVKHAVAVGLHEEKER